MLKSCLQALLNLFVKKSETGIFGVVELWSSQRTVITPSSLSGSISIVAPCNGFLFADISPHGHMLCIANMAHYYLRGFQSYTEQPHFIAGQAPVEKGQTVNIEYAFTDLTGDEALTYYFVPLKKL